MRLCMRAGHLLICEPIMTLGRLRQIVGRLARIGQSGKQISIQLFFVENTIEHRILQLRPPTELADSQVIVESEGRILPNEQFWKRGSDQIGVRLIPDGDTFSFPDFSQEKTT